MYNFKRQLCTNFYIHTISTLVLQTKPASPFVDSKTDFSDRFLLCL